MQVYQVPIWHLDEVRKRNQVRYQSLHRLTYLSDYEPNAITRRPLSDTKNHFLDVDSHYLTVRHKVLCVRYCPIRDVCSTIELWWRSDDQKAAPPLYVPTPWRGRYTVHAVQATPSVGHWKGVDHSFFSSNQTTQNTSVVKGEKWTGRDDRPSDRLYCWYLSKSVGHGKQNSRFLQCGKKRCLKTCCWV